MANELQSLSLLFQNRLFRIPNYQRGYAWLQQQLVDFWKSSAGPVPLYRIIIPKTAKRKRNTKMG